MGMDSFFEQIYALVRAVPEGRVVSYGQIAAMLGRPRAARMVGWAVQPERRAVAARGHGGRNGCGRRFRRAAARDAARGRRDVPARRPGGHGKLPLAARTRRRLTFSARNAIIL